MKSSVRNIVLAVYLTMGCVTTQTYAESLSGADLLSDPNVIFPSRVPSLSGTSLVFGQGSSLFEILVEIPLFPAGTFSAASPSVDLSFIFNITHTPANSDHDPRFLISDGISAIGFDAADNVFGSGDSMSGTIIGSNFNELVFTNLFENAGANAIGDTFDVTIDYTLASISSSVTGAFGAGVGTDASLPALDRSKYLSLIIVAGDFNEEYQFNTVESDLFPIPEPSTYILAIYGLLNLGYRRRKRA